MKKYSWILLAFLLSNCGVKDDDQANADLVPGVTVLSSVQAADPVEFESARLMTEMMRQLGIDAVHRAMPWEQQADLVWYSRDQWQMTAWRFIGRPERLDPDEFVVNLFHSSVAEAGYNIVGYKNALYDSIASMQRSLLDREARRKVIHRAQEIIAEDLPYLYVAHPKRPVAFRSDMFDPKSVVEMDGVGVHNFWTWLGVKPLGEQKNIIANTDNVIQGINPLYISGEPDSRIVELLWDRLMRIGPDGVPELWAAERVSWENDTHVTVELKKNMRWHDGEPVTVDDVIFSFDAIMIGEAPMYKPFVDKIAGIQKLAENQIRFSLHEPWAAFETACLAKVNIIPKHIWSPIIEKLKNQPENAESYQEDRPVGSGPFKFVAWKPSEEVILERNPEHFAAPQAEKWILRIIPNVESALGQLRTGEINFLTEWEGDATILEQAVQNSEEIAMVVSVEAGFRFFALNLRRAPMDDPVFRKALAHALPKEAIIKNIFKGFAVPANSYISPALGFWRHDDLPEYEFDIERAKAVLQAGGYRWDERNRLLRPSEKN